MNGNLNLVFSKVTVMYNKYKHLFLICILLVHIADIPPLQAQNFLDPDIRETPLTESEVKEWIRMRIKSHKIQIQMNANAEQYEDVVNAFFKKRDEILTENGWDVREYNDLENLIVQTQSAIEQEKKLLEENEKRKEELEDLLNSDYLTDEQKSRMIESMEQMQDQQRRYIELYRNHIPAVERYIDTLKELSSWIAGNRSSAPVVH